MEVVQQGDKIFARSIVTLDPYLDIRAFASSGHPDNSANLAKANARAVSEGRGLYIPSQTFKIGSNVNFTVPVRGESVTLSVIENTGTGDAITFNGLPYHSLCENFGIKGNSSSRDGLVLAANTSYSQFNSIYSYGHGRHGLNHRASWATKYMGSKFFENGGIGVYLNTQSGDAGTMNGVSLIQCESRWNGGTDPATTYDDHKGGVRILGAASVAFIGGIYENNNAWAFVLEGNSFAKRCVSIQSIYAEANPYGANVGGFMFLSGLWEQVSLGGGSWIGYGNGAGKTGYAIYATRPDSERRIFHDDGTNFLVASGPGTNIRYFGNSGAYSRPYSTDILSAGATVLLSASNDSQYQIGGFIFCTEVGTTKAACYPFLAQRENGGGGRSVTVGASIINTVTAPPAMAWNGDDLELTFGASHYGYVEFTEWTQGATTYDFNTALFGERMRRK